MKQIKLKTGITIIFSLMCLLVFAHGDEDYSKKKQQDTLGIESTLKIENINKNSSHSHSQIDHKRTNKEKASFKDFATLHPLIVHFPIVLLLIAALIQITGLFVFKEQLSWVTLLLTAGGLIGAYVSSNYVHPHTNGLSDTAVWILEQHEKYADYTVWGALIATVGKAISHFIFKRKIWAEIVVTICLIGTTYFVSEAGHYGAQLIHIEGVGAKGKYIETEAHNHEH